MCSSVNDIIDVGMEEESNEVIINVDKTTDLNNSSSSSVSKLVNKGKTV